MTTIGRTYELIAGHWLPNVPEGHKCRRPHGHNYQIEVVVSGPIMDSGFIIDFFDLDKVVQPLLDQLDHTMLNDHTGLENPTAEYICVWFRERIQKGMNNFVDRSLTCDAVKVWETKDCWALSEWERDF